MPSAAAGKDCFMVAREEVPEPNPGIRIGSDPFATASGRAADQTSDRRAVHIFSKEQR
jgi:hypothetical protein